MQKGEKAFSHNGSCLPWCMALCAFSRQFVCSLLFVPDYCSTRNNRYKLNTVIEQNGILYYLFESQRLMFCVVTFDGRCAVGVVMLLTETREVVLFVATRIEEFALKLPTNNSDVLWRKTNIS